MSMSQVLNNALSGLNATKRGTEIASSNIANALTPGYGVRRLELTARDHGGMGAGVRVAGLTRQEDPFLLGERRLADASAGHHKALAGALSTIESWFGRVGSTNSLSGSVAAFESSLISATSDPSSDVRLERSVTALSDLASKTREIAANIAYARENAEQDIVEKVDKLNSALRQVDALNENIVRLGQGGHPIAGLYDQRQQVIDEISELVPIRQIERAGGRVALLAQGGEVLVDHDVREIGFVRAGVISPNMSFAAGSLSGLTINGQPIHGGGAVGHLKGGALEASFKIRDEYAADAQRRLDGFTRDLLNRMSDTSVDSTIVSDGLLVANRPSGATGDVGLSNVLQVNSILTGNDGPRRLRDGVLSGAAGPVGDATKLNGWIGALQRRAPISAGGASRSVNGHAAEMSSQASEFRVRAESNSSRAEAARATLKQKELSDGVDTDKEMQNLLQLEQAYAANAKVIKAVSNMMQQILEI